jgi:hypothetical protein
MQLFTIQRTGISFRAPRRDDISALARIAAFMGAILKVGSYADRTAKFVSARYQGCAWCDSTELRLSREMEGRNFGFGEAFRLGRVWRRSGIRSESGGS